MHRFISGFFRQWRRKADCCASPGHCARVLSAFFRCSLVGSDIGLATNWLTGLDSCARLLFDLGIARAARIRVGWPNLLASLSNPTISPSDNRQGAVCDA